MASMGEFGKRMAKHGQAVKDNSDALVRKCALAVDGTVVLATPVDTGRARSNWQVALGEPIESPREPYAPGEKGSTGGDNAQAAIAQGKSVISQYRGGANAEIHITNNLPYIGKLNSGSSAQAGAGFVEKAILVGIQAVKGARILGTVKVE